MIKIKPIPQIYLPLLNSSVQNTNKNTQKKNRFWWKNYGRVFERKDVKTFEVKKKEKKILENCRYKESRSHAFAFTLTKHQLIDFDPLLLIIVFSADVELLCFFACDAFVIFSFSSPLLAAYTCINIIVHLRRRYRLIEHNVRDREKSWTA